MNVLLNELAAGIASGQMRLLDLTHPLHPDFPAWPGEVSLQVEPDGDIERDGYFTRIFRVSEHFGTHMDAPAHFSAGAPTLDQIALERLICPVSVIDVREEAAHDAEYCLTVERVDRWEQEHGRIRAGAFVVLRTGWAARLPDVARYFNADASGTLHFPGFSTGAARMLLQRKVSGLGIDTLSIDCGASSELPVHHLCLSAGVFQVENLANCQELPESGALVVIAPIKLQDGSGGPCRVLALVGR